jgi:hypothetical protein
MKAISLWQPYAALMKHGVKVNETRGWATSYRGDLAICSAKKVVPCPADLFGMIRSGPGYGCFTNLQYGFVLCVVRLHAIVPAGVEREVISEMEKGCGDYSDGRFAWQTDNLRRLPEPIPIVGRQSLFELPADVEAKVLEQLKGL